jgi:hypothetical protein
MLALRALRLDLGDLGLAHLERPRLLPVARVGVDPLPRRVALRRRVQAISIHELEQRAQLAQLALQLSTPVALGIACQVEHRIGRVPVARRAAAHLARHAALVVAEEARAHAAERRALEPDRRGRRLLRILRRDVGALRLLFPPHAIGHRLAEREHLRLVRPDGDADRLRLGRHAYALVRRFRVHKDARDLRQQESENPHELTNC